LLSRRRTPRRRRRPPLPRQVQGPAHPIRPPRRLGAPQGRLGTRRALRPGSRRPRGLGRSRRRLHRHLRPGQDSRHAQCHPDISQGAPGTLPVLRGARRPRGEPVARDAQAEEAVGDLLAGCGGPGRPAGAARCPQPELHQAV
ncbi:hypothetical protein H102_05799, partial [Trichophyton rubrum CBS 100081]